MTSSEVRLEIEAKLWPSRLTSPWADKFSQIHSFLVELPGRGKHAHHIDSQSPRGQPYKNPCSRYRPHRLPRTSPPIYPRQLWLSLYHLGSRRQAKGAKRPVLFPTGLLASGIVFYACHSACHSPNCWTRFAFSCLQTIVCHNSSSLFFVSAFSKGLQLFSWFRDPRKNGKRPFLSPF